MNTPVISFWVAAEQLPMVEALYTPSVASPPLRVPADYARRRWEPADALRELLPAIPSPQLRLVPSEHYAPAQVDVAYLRDPRVVI